MTFENDELLQKLPNNAKKFDDFFWNIEIWAVQKHVNLVDLVKSFPTNIFSQNLASIQQRTSFIEFDHLAEKSENGSISNLSTTYVRSTPWPSETRYVTQTGRRSHSVWRKSCLISLTKSDPSFFKSYGKIHLAPRYLPTRTRQWHTYETTMSHEG